MKIEWNHKPIFIFGILVSKPPPHKKMAFLSYANLCTKSVAYLDRGVNIGENGSGENGLSRMDLARMDLARMGVSENGLPRMDVVENRSGEYCAVC